MEAIRDIVIRHVEEVRKGIEANMSSLGRTTSGRSVASLKIEDDGTDGLAHVLLTGGKQWEVMEHGRGPGRVPYNFTQVIREWILKKGISYRHLAPSGNPERGLESLSFLIARSIMKKGTKLYRDHGDNDIFDTLLEEETEKLAMESVGIVETEFETINDKDEHKY